MLYDKNGAAYSLDHEHNGTAYVRPMVKVVVQERSYHGDDIYEDEDFEPAAYLIAMDRAELFEAPPVEQVNADLAAKKEELKALKADAAKAKRRVEGERRNAENALVTAQRQLDKWMSKHKVMIDLGKLLDGQVLYPLSVRESSYHGGRHIPHIPKMSNAKYLAIHSGDFEKGQRWVCKNYSVDTYGNPFMFFDTEAERSNAIQAEFDATCAAFRKKPDFSTTSHTSTTTLHYGTLERWVETHPALSIPGDIVEMKREADEAAAQAKREKLKAELAAMEGGAS